jgi:hypothetical protein
MSELRGLGCDVCNCSMINVGNGVSTQVVWPTVPLPILVLDVLRFAGWVLFFAADLILVLYFQSLLPFVFTSCLEFASSL